MPRPKTPLLDRAKIVAAALELVDESGVDKFSIHAVARKLDVKGPSIYYYFKDRDELLTAVGLTVLEKVRIPKRRSPEWSEQLVDNAVAYHRAVREHPNVAGLLLERKTRQSAAQGFETALEAMQADGIAPADGLAVIDCIEGVALTWVAFSVTPGADSGFGNIDKLRFPLLDAARKKQKYDEASYRRMITALIAGLKGRA